jgi:hypothetical protein
MELDIGIINDLFISFLVQRGYRKMVSNNNEYYYKGFNNETIFAGGIYVFLNDEPYVSVKYPSLPKLVLGEATVEEAESYLRLIKTITWDITSEMYNVINMCKGLRK